MPKSNICTRSLRARPKSMDYGCVVLDQLLHCVESLPIRVLLRAAAGLRLSRGPFLKQALTFPPVPARCLIHLDDSVAPL
jgi:hypothetical protein